MRIVPPLLVAMAALACARAAPPTLVDAGVRACAAPGAPCCAGQIGAPVCRAAGLVCASAACSCLAQVTAVYDAVPLARRVDGTVWVAADRTHFTQVVAPAGPLFATDLVASGSTAYGTAIACAVVNGSAGGGVWCFPLAGPLLDSTDLGAGLGPGVGTSDAVQVVTSAGATRVSLTGVRQLSATMNGGGAAFCAVTDAGGVWCWGYGVSGILGRGDAADSSFARPVLADAATPFAGAVEVRLGFDSACARKTDGSVWCWGGNELGQTGQLTDAAADAGTDADEADAAAPLVTPFAREVTLSGPAARLAANPGNTHCAILRDQTVTCWGWNAYAQAGADAARAQVGPTPVVTAPGAPALGGVVDLAPDRGMQAMCAATEAGRLFCWGHPFAPTGQPDATSPYPVEIPLAPATGAALLPLSAYGGRDGSLVYIDPGGELTFAAGGFPFVSQPPCGG